MKTRRIIRSMVQNSWGALAAGLLLAAAALACNLPAPDGQQAATLTQKMAAVQTPAQQDQPASERILALAEPFQPMATGLRLEGKQLVFDYQPAKLEPQETSLVNIAALMGDGALAIEDAAQVRVNLYSMASPGTPVCAFWVDASTARQFGRGEIEPAAFLDAWQVEDLSSPAARLSQDLAKLGYQNAQVNLAEGVIEIQARQPVLENSPALLASWIEVFSLAAQAFPQAQMVQLRVTGLTEQTVKLPLEAIQAYRSGEIDAAHLLLEMDMADGG